MKYKDLKNGDLFKLFKNDKRTFKKESNGALQITDVYGYKCENSNFRVYPYLDMPVIKEVVI